MPRGEGEVKLTIPLEITVRLGASGALTSPAVSVSSTRATAVDVREAVAEAKRLPETGSTW